MTTTTTRALVAHLAEPTPRGRSLSRLRRKRFFQANRLIVRVPLPRPWARDQGRCQWPLAGGGMCGSTFQPELDHVDGFRPGKPITAHDLRVCCRRHNLEHARHVFGDAFMDSFRGRGRRRRADRETLGAPAACTGA